MNEVMRSPREKTLIARWNIEERKKERIKQKQNFQTVDVNGDLSTQSSHAHRDDTLGRFKCVIKCIT